ncbi:MAG: alpha/beta hydrolase, partial [Anaerolineae bacterium]|nr:alpha/beta hydrolase [Anaerolineae bacterium]
MSIESRQAALEQLRRILRPSVPWETWLAQTGELPPDFTTLSASDDLPDPLAGIHSPADWQVKREQLKALLHQWIIGSVPPAPEHIRAEILSESRGQGATIREVRLHFGPQEQANLWLKLLIPDGEGPFPVFITQSDHWAWAQIALSRGYIGCIYAGADSRDDTDSFCAAYPEHDWSRITRRAWAASRCLDYLESLPQVNAKQVAVTGHSRNGKLSLIAGALDERFAAVISSSSGAGGVLSARYFSEQQFGEGIELITHRFPEWF